MKQIDVPKVDLLSWTFGNEAIKEEDLVYIDGQDSSRVLTKGDTRRLVRQLVAGLTHISTSTPSTSTSPLTVCVHAFNDLYYPPLFLGIIGAGGRFTGSNPAYTAGELAHHLRISQSDLLITQARCLEVALQAAEEVGLSQDRIFLFDDVPDNTSSRFPSWKTLLQYGEADWIAFDDLHTAKTTTAVLASTSGTTGLPKMAARSHHSFVVEHHAMIQEERKPYKVTRLLSVPFFHAFAVPLALTSAIRDGAPTIILPRFVKSDFLRLLHEYHVTETAVVPPLLLAFLSYSPAEQQMLKSLKLAWCAGAPLDPVIQNRACQLFDEKARIAQVWGMTEAGWISTFRYPESDESGAVGRLLPGYEVKIVDDVGNTVIDAHQTGEILVRSPTLMQCYIGNEAATRETTDEDGWLHTGDIARVDNGKIYIVDRKKELIKVRGWQVSPAELEGVLLMHPAIADAAVIGVSLPDSTSEVPRAYVVKRQLFSATTEHDIRAFLLQHLAKYKVGDCDIRFCESIPRSVSGKILRKVLRVEAERELKLLETVVRVQEIQETSPLLSSRRTAKELEFADVRAVQRKDRRPKRRWLVALFSSSMACLVSAVVLTSLGWFR